MAREVKVMSWRRKDLRHICGCSMQLHIAPFFCPRTIEGTKATHINQLSNMADRVPVDINLALTLVTSATITIALQLQLLLDILFSEELQHLDSFT